MPATIQGFLAAATEKASEDLVAALLRLPEDKRAWSPDEKARTALDQVIECALLNGYTADLLQSRRWAADAMEVFQRDKAALTAQDWETLHARLQENTARVAAVIRAVPDDALAEDIAMPWRTQTVAEIMAYCHWNMTYHLGQINYIASLLGCLE